MAGRYRLVQVGLAVFAVAGVLLSACGGDDGDDGDDGSAYKTSKSPRDTISVDLVEYSVTPSKASAAAGPLKFSARNVSKSDVHELAVLRVKADGSFDNTGEVENIEPGKGGSITLDLPAGKYVLACLIAPGEAGSTKDHYKEGMHADFEIK